MDTLKMFALEQYDQDAPQQDGDETENGAKDVPARDRIDDHAGTGEEEVPDGTEVPVHNQQEPNGLEARPPAPMSRYRSERRRPQYLRPRVSPAISN